MPNVCSAAACGNPIHGRGLCGKHYKRLQQELHPERIRAQRRAWHHANKQRVNERQKQRRGANPEKVRQRRRNSYWANIERGRAALREQYANNREARKAAALAKYRANPEPQKERRRASYAADPEKYKNIERERRRSNPDKIRAQDRASYASARQQHLDQAREHGQRRRAQKLKAGGSFTKADWKALVTRSPHCHWCKRPWTRARQPTHDHVTALAKGGSNSLENSVCACLDCNTRKQAHRFNPATGQGILL